MSTEVIASASLMDVQSKHGSSRIARIMLLCLGGWLALGVPCRGLTLYDFGNPIAEEQLYIELINRARADPAGEGVRLATTTDPDVLAAYAYFGVDLAMMQSEFNAIPAEPPLAPNASLQTCSRSHSAWMLANATQSHNETNPSNDPFSRMTAAGFAYTSAGENIYASATSVWYGHAGFEVDWGAGGTGGMQNPRGHRANIHSQYFRELGVGVVFGTNGSTGPQLVTQDFGTSTSNPTLATGVAYYDLNGNGQYDIGEGIAGLTVNVGGSGVTYYCTTAIGGGWVVPVPATAATRTVTFSGLNVNQTATLVIPASTNAKVDLKLAYVAPAITSSASALADSPFTVTFNPVGGAASYKWNRWTSSAAAAENCESLSTITTSTTGTYSVLDTNVKQEGSASFHLQDSTAASQWLQLNNVYYGMASPSLSFQSSVRYATTAEQFKVQFKEEGTLNWLDAYSQTGTNGPGESTFTLRTAALTGMTGKAFRIRFLLNYTSGGGYYGVSGDSFGWLIDAINFSGVAGLSNNTCVTLSGTSGTFTPAAGSYLMSVTPEISSRDYPAGYQILTASAGTVTPPTITTQPVSVTINSGSTATFTVAASGTSPTLQWYAGNSGVTTNPISGATGTSFTTPALTSTASYWVRASNSAGTVNSATATATVITPPTITTQPVSVTINSGSTATFTVAASGTSPTFQWYAGSSGVTTNPVSGATGNSYTTPALTTAANYWVRASNAAGTANSATATATVITPPVITTQPASFAVKTNTSAVLTVVAASGASMTYQWYNGNSPDTSSKISGATATSYTTAKLKNPASYWVCVTNSAGSTNSTTASMTIASVAPAITTQPVSVTINSGGTATFSVAASGSAPAFQWYAGSSGNTSNPVAGATGTSFTTAALTTTTTYWAQAANGLGSANSNSATATVRTATFAAWAASLEAANGLAAGTIANQPNADYDHDGRSNLIEYAFGASPVIPNDPAPRMPVMQTTATQFILQYQRDTSLTDLTFTPQACCVAGNWKAPGESGAPSGFTDVLVSTNGTIQTRQAIVPRASGACLLRIRVTQQ